jgi:purine-nucleoside phosphorylase
MATPHNQAAIGDIAKTVLMPETLKGEIYSREFFRRSKIV